MNRANYLYLQKAGKQTFVHTIVSCVPSTVLFPCSLSWYWPVPRTPIKFLCHSFTRTQKPSTSQEIYGFFYGRDIQEILQTAKSLDPTATATYDLQCQ